jgi:acetyl/propionyl-CoA carboxylase alpha subunit
MIEQIVREEIGLGDDSITAIRLRSAYEQGEITIEDVRERYGESVVAILEAMKMENNINAGKDGVVKAICVNKGDSVLEGTDILVIE